MSGGNVPEIAIDTFSLVMTAVVNAESASGRTPVTALEYMPTGANIHFVETIAVGALFTRRFGWEYVG
jgi:hypothetical protein